MRALSASPPRRLVPAAALIFLVSILLHAPFALFDGFGEQDAARIALAAVHGHLKGELLLSKQWPFSTPLYIHLLYFLLRAEVVSAGRLPCVMTSISLLSGALFSAAFFVFFARATRSLRAALLMTATVQLAPFFWLSSLYGFPTIAALGIFMLSATVFQASLPRKGTMHAAGMIAAFCLFTVAVLFKVDTVTAAGLFCLPVWQSDRSRLRKLAWSFALFGAAASAFFILNRYGLSLSKYRNAGTGWHEWGESFFTGLSSLFRKHNATVIARAAGAASFFCAAIGAVIALRLKAYRAIVVWTVLTFVPVTLFWAFIDGNSARHNLIPAVFVTVLIGLPAAFLRNRAAAIWFGCVLLTAAINYFRWPPTQSSVMPSGRLVESARLFKANQQRRATKARSIAWSESRRILVLAPDHIIPYYAFAPLAVPHLEFIKKGGSRIVMRDRVSGKKRVFYIPPSSKQKAALRAAKKEGYTVFGVR